MIKKDEPTSDQDSLTIEQLMHDMANSEKYSHLQIFLHRFESFDINQSNEYLYVSPDCFGKVIVKDLKFEDPYVIIKIFDCTSEEIGRVKINVHNPSPTVLFILWQDVREMVFADINSNINDNDLLEFDY